MPGNKDDLIILYIDGGVCSQIYFYALGYALKQKGFHVKYDLSWFHTCSKDLTGRFERNFDLLKAFPNFHFEEATPAEIKLYKKKYWSKKDDFEKFVPPLYIGGYSEFRAKSFFEYKGQLSQEFCPIDLDLIKEPLNDILNHNACAIHVRRGDIAKYNSIYGTPCSVDYFLKSIKIINTLEKNVKFYFFSDEPEWIRKCLLPFLDKDISYTIYAQNGSDKGYLDLYLISRCSHVISSKGSLGVVGRLLSQKDGYFISSLTRTFMADYIKKCIFISDEIKRPYDHFISLGYNCEVAFRFVKHFSFEESSLFNWTFSYTIKDLLYALNHLDEIGSIGFELPNPLWECRKTHIRFHGKLPMNNIEHVSRDLLEKDQSDLIGRITHLKEKLLKISADDSSKLFVYKIKKEDINKDLLKNLTSLNNCLDKMAKNYTLLILYEEKYQNDFDAIVLENVLFRSVSYFADDNCVADDILKNGFNEIWDEFRVKNPLNRMVSKKYKFDKKHPHVQKILISLIPFKFLRKRLRKKYHV